MLEMWDSQTVCEQSKVCTKIRNPRGMGRYCCQWIACGREKKKKQGKQKQIKPENKQNLDKLPVSDETQKPAAKEIQNPS